MKNNAKRFSSHQGELLCSKYKRSAFPTRLRGVDCQVDLCCVQNQKPKNKKWKELNTQKQINVNKTSQNEKKSINLNWKYNKKKLGKRKKLIWIFIFFFLSNICSPFLWHFQKFSQRVWSLNFRFFFVKIWHFYLFIFLQNAQVKNINKLKDELKFWRSLDVASFNKGILYHVEIKVSFYVDYNN